MRLQTVHFYALQMGLEELPVHIVEEILLLLPSRDIACAALAIPDWAPILTSKSFTRRHRARFKEVAHHPCLDNLLYVYRGRRLPRYDICKLQSCRTLSNHCMACLLDPCLLLISPAAGCCLCVDHLSIYGNTNDIIWTSPYDISRKHPWPTCWRYVGDTANSRSINNLKRLFPS